ncbi:hypothetical protein COO60DRAFT_1628731 [Scenedesmus sp. NREL 46B-D3]|nr:hypothetical protein COO60DRAFT_1628731 [Scenedesmus sp. NREL 46B-D3]
MGAIEGPLKASHTLGGMVACLGSIAGSALIGGIAYTRGNSKLYHSMVKARMVLAATGFGLYSTASGWLQPLHSSTIWSAGSRACSRQRLNDRWQQHRQQQQAGAVHAGGRTAQARQACSRQLCSSTQTRSSSTMFVTNSNSNWSQLGTALGRHCDSGFRFVHCSSHHAQPRHLTV